MKKSLSLLSCCLIFIVDHISSLDFDCIYIDSKVLSKMSVIKMRNISIWVWKAIVFKLEFLYILNYLKKGDQKSWAK